MTKKIIIAVAMACVLVWIVLLVRLLAGILMGGCQRRALGSECEPRQRNLHLRRLG